MKVPKNLRIEMHPYPHLRDDEGCIMANDYLYEEKLLFILTAVQVAGGSVKDGQLNELKSAIKEKAK